jgi:hypothetical protein
MFNVRHVYQLIKWQYRCGGVIFLWQGVHSYQLTMGSTVNRQIFKC